MSDLFEKPATPLFRPVALDGTTKLDALKHMDVDAWTKKCIEHASMGKQVFWGMPFDLGTRVLILHDMPVTVDVGGIQARWLVFAHTAALIPQKFNKDGFLEKPIRGRGELAAHHATYRLHYEDGTEVSKKILGRYQIGPHTRGFGEHFMEAVSQWHPHATPRKTGHAWPAEQCLTTAADWGQWLWTLWPWQHPHPEKTIRAITFEPVMGHVIVAGLSAGDTQSNPVRWERRRKAIVRLPGARTVVPAPDGKGVFNDFRLDMGAVISGEPRTVYPKEIWDKGYNNMTPEVRQNEILVEYVCHPEACFHLEDGTKLPVAALKTGEQKSGVEAIEPAYQRVRFKVLDKRNKKPVSVKLHIHGEAGEYLPPTDRHRLINAGWFEDYGAEFKARGVHSCTYIDGDTVIDLPLGRVYVEISKGFEIKPIRQVVKVTRASKEIVLTIDKVLDWREQGWVTADTHVHFISPQTARLEGAAEGVNVINLLASQWGELMTNSGDFDGFTNIGENDPREKGDYLVRVSTENRQHVLGHISLIGYKGPMITPMCSGGADEGAMGDPLDVTLVEWAKQCHKQGGLVVLPHSPDPRLENVATIVAGDADGIEMTSWGNIHGGIDPYSLSHWYRYLNCGYFVPAVAGSDKMSAEMPVGGIRVYSHLAGKPFTYDNWKKSIRTGNTFVTYGPLIDFRVEGKVSGQKLKMSRAGGTVTVAWELASVTVPMTRVDLIVNGEIRESKTIDENHAVGTWDVKLETSSWLALLVRGKYPDRDEMIAAHTSAVAVNVAGTPFESAADAMTILDQIEGALVYLDTIGTKADVKRYKQMRLSLVAAHRELHNRMHVAGHYHEHTPVTDHREHHKH